MWLNLHGMRITFFPGAFIRDEQFSLVNEVHENIEQLPKWRKWTAIEGATSKDFIAFVCLFKHNQWLYNSRFMNDNRFIIFNGNGNGMQCFHYHSRAAWTEKRERNPNNGFDLLQRIIRKACKLSKSVKITGWSSASI